VEGDRVGGALAQRGMPDDVSAEARVSARRRRRRHLDGRAARIRQQHVVLDDLDRVETGRDPLIARPLGKQTIARRAGDVWLRRQVAMVGVDASG